MAPSEKCETHQKVFFGVCAFFVTVVIILVGYLVTNDRRAMAAEALLKAEINTTQAIEKKDLSEALLQAAENHADIIAIFNKSNQEIIQRLVRIESQLNMMKLKPKDMTWIWNDVSNLEE